MCKRTKEYGQVQLCLAMYRMFLLKRVLSSTMSLHLMCHTGANAERWEFGRKCCCETDNYRTDMMKYCSSPENDEGTSDGERALTNGNDVVPAACHASTSATIDGKRGVFAMGRSGKSVLSTNIRSFVSRENNRRPKTPPRVRAVDVG